MGKREPHDVTTAPKKHLGLDMGIVFKAQPPVASSPSSSLRKQHATSTRSPALSLGLPSSSTPHSVVMRNGAAEEPQHRGFLKRRALLLLSVVSTSTLWHPAASFSAVHKLGVLSRLALMESDPESALSLWDQAIQEEGASATALYERGNCNLRLRRFRAGLADLRLAQPLLAATRSGAVAFLPSGATVPMEVVLEALAFDGMGLAQGKLGDWKGALDSHARALGTAGAAGASETTIPVSTAFSGLRGGAGSLGQRLELHAAMAKWAGSGDVAAAGADFRRLEAADGQFWDARAALVAALAAGGQRGAAEAAWSGLCGPAEPPPPTSPANIVLSRVNRAAEALLASQLDMACEDFQTGAFVPCDDAGIPGLGGSSSPCILYTVPEVRARLWPAALVAALEQFRNLSAEESSQNRARSLFDP